MDGVDVQYSLVRCLQHNQAQHVHEKRAQQCRHRNGYDPGIDNVAEQTPIDRFLLRRDRMVVATRFGVDLFRGRRTAGAHKHNGADFTVGGRYGQADFAGQQDREGGTNFDGKTTEKFKC
jgi:hypothetical protein